MNIEKIIGLIFMYLVVLFVFLFFVGVALEYGWKNSFRLFFSAPLNILKSLYRGCIYRKEKKIAKSRAVEVWDGDKERVVHWLHSPNGCLGHISPWRAIELGKSKEVLDLLGQIEDGSF